MAKLLGGLIEIVIVLCAACLAVWAIVTALGGRLVW